MDDRINELINKLLSGDMGDQYDGFAVRAGSKAEKDAMMAAMNADGTGLAVDPYIIVDRVTASPDDDPRDCPYEFFTPDERSAMIVTVELMHGLFVLNELASEFHTGEGNQGMARRARAKAKALEAVVLMLTEEIGHITKHQLGQKGH